MNADAFERAFEHAGEFFEMRRRNVIAEWIEFAEQAVDRAFPQFILVDGVDVVGRDLPVNVDEGADERVIIIPAGKRAGKLQRKDHQQNHADRPREFFSIHGGIL